MPCQMNMPDKNACRSNRRSDSSCREPQNARRLSYDEIRPFVGGCGPRFFSYGV